jgi:hypothetical protein
MSIRAIIFGTIVTIVILLSAQLAYVLLASFIGGAAFGSSLIGEHKELMWFVLSIASYALSFLLGGMLTACLCESYPVRHAVFVGFVVGLLSMAGLGDLEALNIRALIMVFVGALFAMLGGIWCAGSAAPAKP